MNQRVDNLNLTCAFLKEGHQKQTKKHCVDVEEDRGQSRSNRGRHLHYGQRIVVDTLKIKNKSQILIITNENDNVFFKTIISWKNKHE